MAEEFADVEFYLPSEFLTDEDIIMEFGSSSEISDDDYLLLKPPLVFSTSPQTTLYGCGQETPEKENDEKETLDLLNKAADEVAGMKECRRNVGTGFFDCSKTAAKNGVKGQLYPPPPPFLPPPFYSHPQFGYFPHHLMWGQVQLPSPSTTPPPQNKVAKNNRQSSTSNTNNGCKTSTRPLGLPQSAWPPLPGQAPDQAQLPTKAQPMMGVSVGTGVFLPRKVALETKKKLDGNATKTKSTKVSQRRSSRKAKVDEIKLPSEWVY